MSIQKIRDALEPFASDSCYLKPERITSEDWKRARAALALLDGMAGEIRAEAFEEAAKLSETWFDRHRPKQPEKSRFDIYDIEHWAKSATRLVAEDIRALAALTETKR